MQASYQVSERRACSAFPINRSTQRYQSRRLDQAGLKMRIKELAATRVRYGYRRIHVLLRREGWEINHKRTHRLYRELGLQLRNKTPKRKVKAKLRDDRTPATAPNECWSMDFLSDQLFDGRKIRVLSIVDDEAVFLEVRGGKDKLIEPGSEADLAADGVEKFITALNKVTYTFFVNGKPYETDKKKVTGAQIKAMVPDWDQTHDLSLEGAGDDPDRIIGDDETVSLDPKHSVRRFSSVPKANFG